MSRLLLRCRSHSANWRCVRCSLLRPVFPHGVSLATALDYRTRLGAVFKAQRAHADIHDATLQAVAALLDARVPPKSVGCSLPRGFRLRTWKGSSRTNASLGSGCVAATPVRRTHASCRRLRQVLLARQMQCAIPQPDTCLQDRLHEQSFTFGGKPGMVYDVTLHIRRGSRRNCWHPGRRRERSPRSTTARSHRIGCDHSWRREPPLRRPDVAYRRGARQNKTRRCRISQQA